MFLLSSNNVICNTTVHQQQNLNGVDLIKFLCSILVFIIHVSPFQGELSGFARIVTFGLQHYICRIAVPFFFTCSGFFLFKNMSFYNPSTDRIKKYCFKILRLFGTWQILLFIGYTEHLWYLGATVIAIALLNLCLHFRLKIKFICLTASLLYIVGLLGDSYYRLVAPLENITFFEYLFKSYEFAFDTTRNGVFMGFIFVLMGAAFSHCKVTPKPLTSITGFVISMICLFGEICLIKYYDTATSYNMYIFLVPSVYFLFSFACTIHLKDHNVYKHLRTIGTLVYFLHIFINEIVSLALNALDNCFGLCFTQYLFIISLTFTLLTAMCLNYLSCKDRFKWINWLTS